jgi:hypothetical protein
LSCNAPKEEVEKLAQQIEMESDFLKQEAHYLHEEYLWRDAARLMIPFPDPKDDENWEKSEFNPLGRHMSRKALNSMRAAVRAERKARMELLVMWLPSVVGIIGALTGLAAVLIGKGK